MKQTFTHMLIEMNAYFGDRKIVPTTTAQLDVAADNPTTLPASGGADLSTIADLDVPLDDAQDVSIDQIIASLKALKSFGIDTLSKANVPQNDPSVTNEPSIELPTINDIGDPVDDDNLCDNVETVGTQTDDPTNTPTNDLPLSDVPPDLSNDLPSDDPADTPSDDPNKMGTIRKVAGAHLVHKRQATDGTFNELWMYNIGDHIEHAIAIKKAIISGTDIPDDQMKSPDGSQRYELSTLGNAQLLAIYGLPN